MKVAIPREIHPGERRVAATPDTVKRLIKLGFEVSIGAGAGTGSSLPDAEYVAAGARVVNDVATLWKDADIVLKVRPPELDSALGRHEAELLSPSGTLVSFVWPAANEALVKQLAARGVTVLAMDQVPRVTRAQKMDALSSMANIAGYRAIIEAASFFGRFFTGQMTAAGKVPPAKVLVIGAGVAGLSAIGTARSLGAIVRAFDTRPAVKEQVESMGAEFLTVALEEDGTGQGGYAKTMSPEFIAAEMALFAEQARVVDIIVTTALIPGKPAPRLLDASIVHAMKPGSVIVDLAAEAGGNCEFTKPGQVVVERGVTVIGYIDLPSRLAPTASQLYGTNLCHLLSDMGGAKNWRVDLEDEVVRGALVLLKGELMWPAPRKEPSPVVAVAPAAKAPQAQETRTKGSSGLLRGIAVAFGALLLLALGQVAPAAFLAHFTVFVLACFIGWQVVWNVTPALHTPLMSVTNAISGIILIGGMLQVSGPPQSLVTILAAIAVLLAMINVAGGFLVTQRMLAMFRR
ncbi:MAG TPA: Re/Si-specific NAD(P)(+) transhydrogenase subunit alpha [Polyangiaceae bacterium]|nr:Re/Si-specific NAD(P)(+) transhydrogenase subunit alpha [Polyangiaceae bacterium]